MQANCAQCHTEENFAGTPLVQRRAASCSSRQAATAATASKGLSEGTLGPDLTEVGKKFKIDYLWESHRRSARQPGHLVHAEVQADDDE